MSHSTEVQTALLRWLHGRTPGEIARWYEFVRDDEGATISAVPTDDETGWAVERLIDRGLIRGHGRLGERVPSFVALAPTGRECVEDYDGNVEAWTRARNGNIDQSVQITATTAQVAAHNPGTVNQIQTLAPDELRRVLQAARAVLQAVPVLPAGIGDEAEQFVIEAERDTPDTGRLRHHRDRVLGVLRRIGEGGAAGALGAALVELLQQLPV